MFGVEVVVVVHFNEFRVGFAYGVATGLRRPAGVRPCRIARWTIPLRAITFAGSTATTAAPAASATSAALLFFFGAASRFGARRAIAERLIAGRSSFAAQYVLLFLQSVAEVVEFAPSGADRRTRLANGFANCFAARFTTRRSCSRCSLGAGKRIGAECRFTARAIF